MLKKASFFLLIAACAVILSGCQSKSDDATAGGTGADLSGAQATSDSGLTVSQSPDNQTNGNISSAHADPSVPASSATNNDKTTTMPASNQPTMIIDQKKTYTAIMHTTAGNIELALNAKATPLTVNNFVWLAKKNFYNGIIFHRVIKDFMIQSGDPKGDGTGGPGYQFDDEAFTGEYTRGTLAMANAGPNTNGSQFFIMHQNYPLPKNYVIFGRVTKGLETVDKIAEAPVKISASGETSQPIDPVKITSIEIIEK